jgi:hypothetical protein
MSIFLSRFPVKIKFKFKTKIILDLKIIKSPLKSNLSFTKTLKYLHQSIHSTDGLEEKTKA